ncbi:DUF5615 family PIN-like protein [Candidatus Wolfebacteria bacterium]|nr:DUF5615 family PIN-like protein [Candidatus Wolfebacteria bacterium]
MLFLIDENIPRSLGLVFKRGNSDVEFVYDSQKLRGKSDEVILNYAHERGFIIVTRDLQFANPYFYPSRLAGLVIIRFPNEISVPALCDEVERLTADLKEVDYRNLLIIEPGLLRSRKLL